MAHKVTSESKSTKMVKKTSNQHLIPKPVHDRVRHASEGFITTYDLDRILDENLKQELLGDMQNVQNKIEEIRSELENIVGHAIVGKGFRNVGFMMMGNQSANNNPDLFPNFIDLNDYNSTVADYLFMRDMVEDLLGLTNTARNAMNILGNEGFRYTLAYYNNLRNITRTTTNDRAQSAFNSLSRFFASRRTASTEMPSEMQLEHDIHSLMHGHKDGEIIIRNENPQTVGGLHEVIDNTHSHKDAIKVEAKVDEQIER